MFCQKHDTSSNFHCSHPGLSHQQVVPAPCLSTTSFTLVSSAHSAKTELTSGHASAQNPPRPSHLTRRASRILLTSLLPFSSFTFLASNPVSYCFAHPESPNCSPDNQPPGVRIVRVLVLATPCALSLLPTLSLLLTPHIWTLLGQSS